jgi:hypothetical protein
LHANSFSWDSACAVVWYGGSAGGGRKGVTIVWWKLRGQPLLVEPRNASIYTAFPLLKVFSRLFSYFSLGDSWSEARDWIQRWCHPTSFSSWRRRDWSTSLVTLVMLALVVPSTVCCNCFVDCILPLLFAIIWLCTSSMSCLVPDIVLCCKSRV